MKTAVFALFLLLPVEKKIGGLCWSVTSYWPFGVEGEPIPFNGQADETPGFTANMTPITPADEWLIAAVPFDWVGSTLIFPNGWVVNAADTFGNLAYQSGPIYHDYYGQWVFPVDILTPEPLHYLECSGVIR